jgi:hypothetical protein
MAANPSGSCGCKIAKTRVANNIAGNTFMRDESPRKKTARNIVSSANGAIRAASRNIKHFRKDDVESVNARMAGLLGVLTCLKIAAEISETNRTRGKDIKYPPTPHRTSMPNRPLRYPRSEAFNPTLLPKMTRKKTGINPENKVSVKARVSSMGLDITRSATGSLRTNNFPTYLSKRKESRYMMKIAYSRSPFLRSKGSGG